MRPRGCALTRRSLLAGAAAGAGALLLGRDPARPARRAAQVGAAAHPRRRASPRASRRGQQSHERHHAVDEARRASSARAACRSRSAATRTSARSSTARTSSPTPSRAFAVHHRAEHRVLQPGEQYFYRFYTCDENSPGRAASGPRGRPTRSEPVRIGFFSCQAFEAGYYIAHDGLANEPDLDVVVCLGDYIYEQPVLRRARARTRPAPTGRRGPDARRVPREVRALPLRPAPARGPPQVPADRDLGRPRGRGQLRARQAGRGDDDSAASRSPQRRAARLPRVLRAHAAHPRARGARPHLRDDPARRERRPVPARPAPVPRRPGRAATSSSCRAASPRRPAGRSSARRRRRGSRTRWRRSRARGRSSPTRR